MVVSVEKVSLGAGISAGQAYYYLNLARADYYTAPGEPEGIWLGEGANRLGLFGTVNKHQLVPLMGGRAPHGTQLRQNQMFYRDGRKPIAAWDFVFNVSDKSDSLWFALSPRDEQRAIQTAHLIAVKAGVAHLQKHAISRCGKGGAVWERAELVCAAFEHAQNRASEPHLHTHVLVLNVARRPDGTWGTVHSPSLYAAKRTAQAIYHAVLANELRKLGIPLERTTHGFRISLIPQKVVEAFSSRRADIKRELERTGESGFRAARRAALRTRPKKQTLSRDELFRRAREKAAQLGFNLEHARALYLSKRRLSAVETALGAPNARERSSVATSSGYRVVHSLFGEARIRASEAQARRREPTLLPRQEFKEKKHQRLHYLTGPAGSGKTERIAREIRRWTKRAHVVPLGATKTSSRELAEAAGTAMTLASFFYRSGLGVYDAGGKLRKPSSLAHHARMLYRAALKRPTWRFTRERLGRQSIVVLDAAHLVSTRDLERLLRATGRAQARVVLVGDDSTNSAFSKLVREGYQGVELTQVKRQRHEWMRDAAQSLRAGRLELAQETYALAGKREEHSSRASLLDALLSRLEGHAELRRSVIIASSRSEAAELNRLAQKTRARSAMFRVARHRGGKLIEGDRVFFHRDNPLLGVRAGELGTIERVASLPFGLKATLTVALDRDRRKGLFTGPARVRVPLERYGHVSLGYALTTRQAEGASFERTCVIESPRPREAYAQLTRHRADVHVFKLAEPHHVQSYAP